MDSLLMVIIFVVAVVVVAVALGWYLRQKRAQLEPQEGDTAPVPRPPAGPEPQEDAVAAPSLLGLRPELPIVLIHGLLGFDHIKLLGQRVNYFRGVAEALQAERITVYAPRLPPLASVPERAFMLARFIESLPHERISLVAHSMGGLDARYALAHEAIGARVASLVTIATPHRGTPLADISAAAPIRALRSMIGRVGLDTEAIDWLTTQRLQRFNRDIVDHPGVLYGSIIGRSESAQARANPVLLSGHVYLSMRVGSNDGMVPASSQHWGELFDEVDADHWAQIGWSTYFDAGGMYIRLYESLRRRGL